MQALAERSPDQNAHRLDEPYRRALTGMYARLAATLHELTGTEALRHAVAPQDPYRDPSELLADLRVIEASLKGHHGEALIPLRLSPLIRAVQVFGFHLATLDLRQSSDQHELVVAELLATARIEADYSALDEAAKRELLLRLLNDARPLRVFGAQYTEKTLFELATFEAAREVLARFGRQALRHYIISHTESVSDLLEVALLLRETGLLRGTLAEQAISDLIIVPLFETIGDPARRAGHHARVLRAARHPRAGRPRRRRAGHHAGLLRQQQGRRHLHQQLGAVPRRDRAGGAVRRAARAAPGARKIIRCACSTGAAAPWGAAAAPATRPSWRSRPARCAGRSG